MTEILTESFCERCGTRYTFESARPRARLKGVKTWSRGLKNFVLSDDTSMDEAMAAARSETEREATAHQLDAFHETFNFCMSCRQYTCPNCWNEAEARCLTCAPLALAEAPAAADQLPAFGEALLIGEAAPANGVPEHEHDLNPDHWALAAAVTKDATHGAPVDEGDVALPTKRIDVELAASSVTEVDPAAATPDIEAPVATGPAVVPTDPVETATPPEDPARKAAKQTSGLLRRFRPGQSLDAELDAFERGRRDEAALTEPAVDAAPAAEEREMPPAAAEAMIPKLAAETIAEPAVEAAPEAVVEEALEPAVQAAPEPSDAAIAKPAEEALAAATVADVVEQPTWRITAPDPEAQPAPADSRDPGVPLQAARPSPVTPGAKPEWPARPEWPGAAPAAGLPFLGRPATPQGGIEALWAASNQELVTAVPAPQGRPASGIQPCISCGLSLSATARFCRRCGTLQSH